MLSPALLEKLLQFRRERDWEQFHTPRNLSAAICVEAAELLDHFRWARDADQQEMPAQQRTDMEHEVADIAILLSYFCHDLGIDLETAVQRKLELNGTRYPVHKSRGSSNKYDSL
ncbi:MAG: nucleotide pyrophosphohydrolase [Candidatus Cloacimonetes bacterium]|nr:nucleotide pyrophosphohydrolase [Candidatus Cloacimonadota bacterium]